MTLIVHAMGAYASYSIEEHAWRQADYNINKLVKALKGETFTGYADMKDVNNSWLRITPANSTVAYQLFGNWANDRLRNLKIQEFVLVPVPSSTCTTYHDVTTPVRMAQTVLEKVGSQTSIGQWLRFCEVMPKAHEGGTRNRTVIEEKLRVSRNVAASQIVLIDDVKTTGAHLKACANVLRNVGAIVNHVIVAASTSWTPHPTPLQIAPEDLEADINFDGLIDDL